MDDMPATPPAASSRTTLLLVLLLSIALFPGVFHSIWTFPFSLISPPPAGEAPPPEPRTTSCPPASTPGAMSWVQRQFTLPARSRGSYLITDHVVSALPEIKGYKVGLLNLFVQHTSCALSLNENWDDDVRADMSDALDRIAPEVGPKGEELYRHDAEGRDDMPVCSNPYLPSCMSGVASVWVVLLTARAAFQAHIKSALVGASVTIPITDGKLVSPQLSLDSWPFFRLTVC